MTVPLPNMPMTEENLKKIGNANRELNKKICTCSYFKTLEFLDSRMVRHSLTCPCFKS